MTTLYTTLALTAFAGNSILCRLALGGATVDAATFTTVRLVSGALMLVAILRVRKSRSASDRPSAGGAAAPSIAVSVGAAPPLALFSYAIAFSLAYVTLTTGTGALILFAAVQSTMLLMALRSGERPGALEWTGLATAIAGLLVLVFPGLTAPPLAGSIMMAVAGISWGFYSLWGRGTRDPLAETARNFVLSIPLAALASLVALVATDSVHASSRGLLLASSSGAITSGVGYVIWYAALRGLSATKAATVQLATPILTSLGGVIFLSERISVRLLFAAAMILGGIGVTALGRRV
jgi:drug/metabolite transporter (DMT)-like permease